MALFVTEDLIITVETASLEEDRERHEAAFAAAVKSLSVN